MKEYQNFKKEGNQYILKPQIMFNLLIVIFLGLLGIWTILESDKALFGYLIIGFAALAWYSSSKRKLVIDIEKRVFVGKNNGFQPEFSYAFEDYDGVTMHKVKYFGVLTMNVSAVLYFMVDGKEKRASANQSFTSAPIQKLINELNEILEECGLTTDNQNSASPMF